MIKYICDDCGLETTKDRIFYDNYNSNPYGNSSINLGEVLKRQYILCPCCQSYRLGLSMHLLPLGEIIEKNEDKCVKYINFETLANKIKGK